MFSKKAKRETRELVIRTNLLDKLKQVVQSLIQPKTSSRYDSPVVLGHADNTNVLCNVLEAIFIHGLRDSLGEKMSTLFGDPDRMPVPNFWPVILIISHRDLLEQVETLAFINSEVGKSRAWIRLAINQSQISSYLSVLSGDQRTLKEYYRTNALLREQECCDIMLRVLQPITSLSLNLATNAAVLNLWTQTPLVLAGLWAPAIASQSNQIDPIMAATDVASTVIEPATEGIDIPITEDTTSDVMFKLIIGGTPETNFIKDHAEEIQSEIKETETHPNLQSKDKDCANPPVQSTGLLTPRQEKVQSAQFSSDKVFSDSLEPTSSEATEPIKRHTGSSISSLTRSTSTIQDAQAYNDLFSAFNLEGETEEEIPSLLIGAPVEDLPSATEEPLDQEAKKMMPYFMKLTNEAGLDAQEYQCNGCKAYIGMIYGKPRVCSYDSKYYCNECHEDETAIIPARLVHNWDFSSHAVCKANKKWLASVYHQPLIDLRNSNSKIYCHVDDLAEMQLLRKQLVYLRAYLLTCNSGVEQELKKQLWPREYLYEHVHLYSVFDLQLLSAKQLIPIVRKAVTWGRKHVLDCKVCALRGFICEICKDEEIIYPFQIGNTYTCNACFAVYHFNCARTKSCPRCLRIQSRKKSKDSSNLIECED